MATLVGRDVWFVWDNVLCAGRIVQQLFNPDVCVVVDDYSGSRTTVRSDRILLSREDAIRECWHRERYWDNKLESLKKQQG